MPATDARCAICSHPEEMHFPDEGMLKNAKGSTYMVPCNGTFMTAEMLEEQRVEALVAQHMRAARVQALVEERIRALVDAAQAKMQAEDA